MQHNVSRGAAVISSKVIIDLVLRREPREEHKPYIGSGKFKSRESAGDPGALVFIGV